MIEAFFSTPYAVIGVVLLACFGGYVTYRNNRISRFAAASAAFRSAFSDTLSSLRNGTEETYSLLEQRFPAHESSVNEFYRHLSFINGKRFMKAWYGYYCDDGDPSTPFLGQYSEHIGSTELAKKAEILQYNVSSI